jgi:hypothetical protein
MPLTVLPDENAASATVDVDSVSILVKKSDPSFTSDLSYRPINEENNNNNNNNINNQLALVDSSLDGTSNVINIDGGGGGDGDGLNMNDGRKIYATSEGADVENQQNFGYNNPIKKRKEFPILDFIFCSWLERYKIGNMHVLAAHDGAPIVIVGSWWPFCIFVTVPTILIPAILVFYFLIIPEGPTWMIPLYAVSVAITLIGLCGVSCRNPGLVERTTNIDNDDKKKDWMWNDRVKSFRPRGALYCESNDIVVEKYDHVCPWTGKFVCF